MHLPLAGEIKSAAGRAEGRFSRVKGLVPVRWTYWRAEKESAGRKTDASDHIGGRDRKLVGLVARTITHRELIASGSNGE